MEGLPELRIYAEDDSERDGIVLAEPMPEMKVIVHKYITCILASCKENQTMAPSAGAHATINEMLIA